MSGMRSAALRKPVPQKPRPGFPKPKPKPTDKDKKKLPPRPLRLERTLPFEDHISTVFDHNLDIFNRRIFLDCTNVNGEDWESGVDARMYDFFIKAISLLENESRRKPIKIIISSFGGLYDYGMGIYDRINLSPCPIVLHGYGPIMSMGSIFFQAKGKRLLSRNAVLMLHYTAGSHDKHDKLGKTGIKEHDRHDELMLGIYCERIRGAGKSVDKKLLDQQIKESLYLTADRAIEMGLADGYITEP